MALRRPLVPPSWSGREEEGKKTLDESFSFVLMYLTAVCPQKKDKKEG